jgi:allophanate hydrolase subunit 2
VPASNRLLQKLRETWGDEVAQDLVTWVDEAQTVNKPELSELSDRMAAVEVTLGRVDAAVSKLDERIALSEVRLEARLDERIALSETRFEARLDERIALSETRFDARLDERIALAEARFEARLNERLGISEARLEAKLDERVNGVYLRLDERINGVYLKLDERINGVRLEIAHLQGHTDTGIATLRADLATQLRDQMKWMFVFWMGTLLPLATLIVALGKGWF